ncbi:MAG TPA: GAF domain-containing protein, partial [Anaerolineae bacterium]|nr:GAF domain-containing protein [Anaerolineae bacterium]
MYNESRVSHRHDKKYVNTLSILIETCMALSSSLRLPDVLAQVSQAAYKLSKMDRVVIGLYSADKDIIETVSGFGKAHPLSTYQVSDLGDEFTKLVQGSAVVIEDITKVPLSPKLRELQQSLNIRSALAVPIMQDGTLVGTILTYSIDTFYYIPESLIKSMVVLAKQAAIAIRNAGAYEAEKEARERALYELGTSNLLLESLDMLTLSLDLQDVPQTLADIILKVTGVQRISINQVNEATGELTVLATRGVKSAQAGTRLELDQLTPQAQQAVREGRALIADYELPALSPQIKEKVEEYDSRVALFVPITLGESVVGLISLDDPGERHEFTERDIGLVEGVATEAAVMLENARLYKEQKEEAALSNALNGINAIINSTLDTEEMLQKSIVEAGNAIGCESATLILQEDDHWIIKFGYGLARQMIGMQLSPEQTKPLILTTKTRGPLVINDVNNDNRMDKEVIEELNIRSGLIVPLISRSAVIGVITFAYHSTVVGFTGSQIDFASKLALAIALSLENTRLFNAEVEAQRQAKQMLETSNLLLKAADTLSLSLDLQEILEALADVIAEVTGRARISIQLLDERTGELATMATRGTRTTFAGTRFKLRRMAPQFQQAITEKRIFVIDYEASDMPEEIRKAAKTRGSELTLLVPLVLGNEAIGVLAIDEPGTRHEFTQREIELVEGIASQAAVAIENARLHEKSVERARTFEAITQMGSLITSTLNMKDALAQVTSYATILLDTPASLILTLDEEDKVFRVAASEGISTELTKEVLSLVDVSHMGFERQTPSLIDDLSTLSAIPFFAQVYREGFISAIVSPIFMENGLYGLLIVQDKKRLFLSDEDSAAIRLFTGQAVTAIKNADRYKAEHDIADTLQSALLMIPEKLPGIDFGYIYRSATETARVGGDFYDIFEIEHDKIGIIVGDVSGKGIEAATLTSVVRSTIKAHSYKGSTPAMVIAKTNDTIVKTSPTSNFVTIFFGVLNRITGNLAYCSAGHPPTIIKRKTGSLEILEKHSPIIGAFPNLDYRSGKTTLKKDDVLIAYTDGIIEARNDGDLYGEQRFTKFIKDLGQISVK